ncbi:MAG: ATP-binding protein [Saccharofermentanales bacterium]
MSDKFYKFLEYMTIGSSLHDEFGNFIYANPIFCKTFKTSIQDVISNKFNEKIFNVKLDNSDFTLNWINTNYKTISNKIIKIVSDDIKWIKMDSIKIKNGNEYYAILYDDITDSMNHTYLYDEIFNNIDTGIMILDNIKGDFYLKKINPYGKSICNLNNIDINKNIKELNLPLLNGVSLYDHINNVILNNKPISLKFAKCVRNKKHTDEWITLSIHKTEGNKIIVLFHDVTDIINYKNIIEEQNKLKSVFLSNMSHEIRSPINAIVGFIDILETSNDKKEIDKSINIIKSSSQSLIKLLDDVSDMSKIEAGKISINKSNFDVNMVIDELCEINRIKLSKDVKLICDTNINKELIILSDEYRFKQILTNLINNSIKFTKKGHIKLGYYLNNGYITFYIKDTGIGVSDDNKKLIFKRYHKAVESKVGTGIGLSITKQLVNLLGGDIWFKSKIGEGSTFYFKLPYKEINSKKTITSPISNFNNLDLTGKKILLVEDIDFNIKLILSYLEPTNANIIISTSGNDALLKYNEHKNDLSLILMDIQLPEMDGTEVTQIIRTIDTDIPIIAQTAYAIKEEIDDILEYGFNDLIKKPIIRNDLLKSISKFI